MILNSFVIIMNYYSLKLANLSILQKKEKIN